MVWEKVKLHRKATRFAQALKVLDFDSFLAKYLNLMFTRKTPKKVLEFSILSWNSANLSLKIQNHCKMYKYT
jgi:hypothetical protein